MRLSNVCNKIFKFNLWSFLILTVIFTNNLFAANFKEDFLWINTDSTKTKISCINVGSYENQVKVKFVFSNKLNEKISTTETLGVGEKREFLVSDFNSDKNNINKLKVQFGNLSIYSDSIDAVCSVSYDFLKNNNKKTLKSNDSLVASTLNLEYFDIGEKNAFFIFNQFLYKNVKNVRLYIYNLSKNKFDADLKRYDENGKTIKERSVSVLSSERKIFRYNAKTNQTFIVSPKDENAKYVSYMVLEFNDGSVFAILPLQKFSETSFLNAKGLLSMFNTSKKQKKILYKVYSNGKLLYEDNFTFEPHTQKFINLDSLTKNVELPIIKFGTFDNSRNFIVGSLIKNDKNNFDQIRLVDKKNSVGTHNISYYDVTNNEGVLNIFNESSVDNNVKVAFLNGKEFNLKIKKDSLVQVPLNKVLENKNLKGNVIVNSDSPFSLNFESLKGSEKSNIGKNLILLNNVNKKTLVTEAKKIKETTLDHYSRPSTPKPTVKPRKSYLD